MKRELAGIGLWEVHPRNLFRISWKNEPRESGGGFGGVNYLEFPPALTGVQARIIALVGKWFPTGAHKVGAAFACLVPRLVTGQFDPSSQKAVWPSTGNYCRGGAYDSALLGCQSIAILPEGMSRERFEWLSRIAGEVIRTPGSESNVKEIFDKCWELRQSGQDLMIFNQFEEAGNYLWHYEVTGHAMQEVLERELKAGDTYHGVALTTGSAGTIACGDYLKQRFPGSRIVASEALQCPTLLANGFGAHRIEGIGDKHVPWIHNVKNTDLVVAIDDNAVVNLARLFNEKAGRAYLARGGVPAGAGGAAGPAGLFRHRQPAVLRQVRQVLRAGPPGRGAYRAHRFHAVVRQPPGGDAGAAGRVPQRGCRRPLRPLLERGLHRPPAGAVLPGPPPGAQLEVLHLGRAAGPQLRGDHGPVVRPAATGPASSPRWVRWTR